MTSPIRVTTDTNARRSFCIFETNSYRSSFTKYAQRGYRKTRKDSSSRLCQRMDAQTRAQRCQQREIGKKGKKKLHWGKKEEQRHVEHIKHLSVARYARAGCNGDGNIHQRHVVCYDKFRSLKWRSKWLVCGGNCNKRTENGSSLRPRQGLIRTDPASECPQETQLENTKAKRSAYDVRLLWMVGGAETHARRP